MRSTVSAERTRRQTAPTATTARPRIRGQSAVAAYAVEIDVRTAYDFAVSLGIGGSDMLEIAPADSAWLRGARSALSAVPGGGLWVGSDAEEGLCGALTGVIVEHTEARTAADVVTLFDRIGDDEIIRLCFGHKLDGGDGSLLDRAAEGDPKAAADLARQAGDQWAPALIALKRDPVPHMQTLRATLRAWQPSFTSIEERIGRALERDVARRQEDIRTLDPGDLIERTTGGIRFVPDAGVRRVVLAPSYFARPFNWVNGSADWRLFCYPIADEALEEQDRLAPSATTVRLFRALGDETRLRIMKLLSGRDMYLTELAEQLGLSKPTISHHVATLRAAGLVSVTDQGAMTYYSLRRQRLDEAGVELRHYLE